ncbi:MAG: PIN domain-containing protein [Deltaproteobacteria bacterium]|nr:PIN domain-containing protein [Deltaproteobacteria bacterium]
MSFAIDANILLHAANASCQENARAVRFLEQCARRGELMCLAWPTVMAFLRISTHPGIFPRPLSWKQASGYIDSLLALPHARVLTEQEGFWSLFHELADVLRPRGNLLPDVHLAAMLKQNGVLTLYTHDRDFRRFDFLEIRSLPE